MNAWKVAVIILAALATAGVLAFNVLTALLPPCAEEDGSGGQTPCIWSGASQGNGQGGFVVVWEAP
jgi:hypothetical protein